MRDPIKKESSMFQLLYSHYTRQFSKSKGYFHFLSSSVSKRDLRTWRIGVFEWRRQKSVSKESSRFVSFQNKINRRVE